MRINLLFSAPAKLWDTYKAPLETACKTAGLDVHLSRELEPAEVDYIIYAPNPDLTDFSPYQNCKAVLSLWAGVEKIAPNPTLTQPLCRMVDEGLAQGMRDWVCGHVLRHHLGMDRHIHGLKGQWERHTPPLSKNRKVTVLGLGQLGQYCAQALRDFGFDVAGWSRRPKNIDGITCFAGPGGLKAALQRSEILVLLLPDTAQTAHILDTDAMAALPQNAVILNPGRGTLIDEDALLSALDAGHLQHATLDVFKVEPLPPTHPFWHHPKVTVTPHIAAETRPETASQVIAENMRRREDGQVLLNLVDRQTGY